MVQIMGKLSVILKTEIRIASFCTGCKILTTYIYNRRVLLFWQTEDVQN